MRGLFLSERRITIKNKLSGKEKLFCTYYSLSCNGREAAAKSGYVFPEKSSVRLLRKPEIRAFIEELEKQRRADRNDIAQGYVRLAFGCVSDAIRRMFSDTLEDDSIDGMDLFNISEIKKKKGGDIEIKSFDRLKALEKLQQLCDEGEGFTSDSLYSAIASSAAVLKEDDLE